MKHVERVKPVLSTLTGNAKEKHKFLIATYRQRHADDSAIAKQILDDLEEIIR